MGELIIQICKEESDIWLEDQFGEKMTKPQKFALTDEAFEYAKAMYPEAEIYSYREY